MLSKTIDGKNTTYTYDESNQLASSTVDGKITTYQYDAAGRMTQEGDTSYSYNFDNKVVKAGENTYNYYASGQIASTTNANGKNEEFSWDGLALLQRNNTNYLNEPYATGGNPVLAGKKVLFNGMLGTTQGSISQNGKYQPTNKTAFGGGSKEGFFTGKPHVEGLGSVFLFRNYRSDLGKWQTSDPIAIAMAISSSKNMKLQSKPMASLGYPDGWNNLAYVNNHVTNSIDWQGTASWLLTSTSNNIPENWVVTGSSPEGTPSIYPDFPTNPAVGTNFANTVNQYVTFTYTIDGVPGTTRMLLQINNNYTYE